MRSINTLFVPLLVALSLSSVVHCDDQERQQVFEDDQSAAGALEANQSLIWGTYRPNVYFGLKPRIPNSLITGLIWFGLNDGQSVSSAFVSASPRSA